MNVGPAFANVTKRHALKRNSGNEKKWSTSTSCSLMSQLFARTVLRNRFLTGTVAFMVAFVCTSDIVHCKQGVVREDLVIRENVKKC